MKVKLIEALRGAVKRRVVTHKPAGAISPALPFASAEWVAQNLTGKSY